MCVLLLLLLFFVVFFLFLFLGGGGGGRYSGIFNVSVSQQTAGYMMVCRSAEVQQGTDK